MIRPSIAVVGLIAVALSSNASASWEGVKSEALAKLKFKVSSYSQGGFGAVLLARGIVIRNDSDYAVSDIGIRCECSAPIGTVLQVKTETIYRPIRPRQQIEIGELNLGFVHSQVSSVSCAAVSLEASLVPVNPKPAAPAPSWKARVSKGQ
ncbi:MAG: hypothetical protein ACKVP7_04685 [Hyphomicrobiaceae bacterium]